METPPRAARILVVDDEYLVRWSLWQSLRDEGYAVTTLATAQGVLKQAARADLVLLDWHLAGSDGLNLAEELKGVLPGCPIILMTADPTPELMKRAEVVGITRVLLKPFDLEQVVAFVGAALKGGRPRREAGGER